MPLLLILGGLAVGLLTQAADRLGADSENVLFSGQTSVPAVVAEDSAKIVLILLVAKALGYAVCLGCGFQDEIAEKAMSLAGRYTGWPKSE
jgi:chloride channel protein, CIC family